MATHSVSLPGTSQGGRSLQTIVPGVTKSQKQVSDQKNNKYQIMERQYLLPKQKQADRAAILAPKTMTPISVT